MSLCLEYDILCEVETRAFRKVEAMRNESRQQLKQRLRANGSWGTFVARRDGLKAQGVDPKEAKEIALLEVDTVALVPEEPVADEPALPEDESILAFPVTEAEPQDEGTAIDTMAMPVLISGDRFNDREPAISPKVLEALAAAELELGEVVSEIDLALWDSSTSDEQILSWLLAHIRHLDWIQRLARGTLQKSGDVPETAASDIRVWLFTGIRNLFRIREMFWEAREAEAV
jgi:hypothetical protein